MELFSEIYNCYYQIIETILNQATQSPITETEMLALCHRLGFDESGLTIVPKLTDGTWQLLDNTKNGYVSKIFHSGKQPLTFLQKSWLKAILEDKRMNLFLGDSEADQIKQCLSDVQPLFTSSDFYYYDQFTDGDDYDNPLYQEHFHILLEAVRKRQYLDIIYHSRRERLVHHIYLPCKIEYSVKNDRFRVLALYRRNQTPYRLEIININRIESITACKEYHTEPIDLEQYIRDSYYKEPVTLIITTKRNALERAMLHFANYEKKTRKLDDTHYECQIFYNTNMETELLIEILSFGHMVQVTGPESFVAKIRERVRRQADFCAEKS